MAVELIPGTSIPIQSSFGSPQHEGRGSITPAPGREPVSIFERLSARDDISPAELAFLLAAVKQFDRRPRKLRTIYQVAQGQTDATTGNLALPLFQCPAGCEAHVTRVNIDAPGSTLTPSAPFANALSFAYLSSSTESTAIAAGQVDALLRPGLVAFAPTSAAGPFLPGEWTYNDTNAIVLQGGDYLWLAIHGGSQAGITNLQILCTYRINLFGYEEGQL